MRSQRAVRIFAIVVVLALGALSIWYASNAIQQGASVPSALIPLAPFTLEGSRHSGVVPADWDELQPGTAIRSDDVPINTTYIVHIANPGQTAIEASGPLLEAMGLDALPEPAGTFSGRNFEWVLYDITYTPPDREDLALRVRLATAEDDDGAFIVALQAEPDEFESLVVTVLNPALDVFGLPLADIYAYLGNPSLSPVRIDTYGIAADVPSTWANVNLGAWMRSPDGVDVTTLLVQSRPGLAGREIANLLLRDVLNLQVELPDEGYAIETSALTWTMYRIDFDQQNVPLTVQLAIASDAQRAYMVALLSEREEAETLQDTIVIPVVRSVRVPN